MSGKDEFKLSRRKALGALGTIGIASAGVGMGTTAFFSDSESTSGSFTAGKLDLKIGWEVSHYGNNVDPELVEPTDTNGDGLGIELNDVKPGDSGWIRFEILNEHNPAWVWFRGRLKNSMENGQTDAELEAEGEDTDGYGELDENLAFRSFYDQNQNATVVDGQQTGNIWNDRYIQKPLDLKATQEQGQYGSIPVLLDGVRDGDSPDVVGGAYPDGEPIDPFGNGTSQYITVRWSLPKEVGNEVQSDAITVCFDFYSEQSRHNPNGRFRGTDENGDSVTPDGKYPTNPWADEYSSGAFMSLADQDVILGPNPDNGQIDSTAGSSNNT
ncbi:TasA family protein [Halobellus sp. Atlit-38R]|uniref:TasA family protein n=1 Tax=Halobellus sp. Atlit-38R TaxID=2282131 RepID=UPI0013142785|nr:TasA family protein [Halobellus sp. Atlit-38R]